MRKKSKIRSHMSFFFLKFNYQYKNRYHTPQRIRQVKA